MIFTLASMFNYVQVGSVVIDVVENQELMVFLTYMYIQQMHMVFGIFWIWHVLVLNQIA